uniref:Histidine--tRNA ligase, chloroplastic n=1 Tax=Liagora harveyana TaxID=406718 RepID=A0A1G4NVF5_9FLOR|nr:Histidine-tRNA ligase [Liagora harveyana]SCW22668.1 Histidine-tRNA ligase [Liagora harveyana]
MQSIRGMHDILPEEIEYWQHIYNKAFEILDTANYKEIRTPILESQTLFERSIGQETDIIKKEMYTFIDRGNREVTLRPEGTAGVARAIIQHKLCENNSVQKLWYLGPMFRYERPQKGRQRQFHQLGLECYGTKNPIIDAEVIFLARTILQNLQFNSVTLEINSIGNQQEREIYESQLKEYLSQYIKDLDKESAHRISTNPFRVLDSKNPKLTEILRHGPKITDYLQKESLNHFNQVQEYLNNMGINFSTNHNLVRGLDYYNDTVFEIKTDLLGSQDTICGGGRYDHLTQQIGGKQINAVGWGIGIERLLLLTKNNLLLTKQKICIYIAIPNINNIKHGLKITQALQQYHLKYELDMSGCSIKKHIQKASKKQAMLCLLIGQDEIQNQTISLKWMYKNKQLSYSKASFYKLLPEIQKEYTQYVQSSTVKSIIKTHMT